MNSASIAGPTEYKPPRVTGGYTSGDKEARDDYGEKLYETDPSAALLASERRDLCWFFTEAESDLGITSTTGQQLDAAQAQRISDEASKDARAVKALRSRLLKGWKPKPRKAKRKPSDLTQIALDHLGLSRRGDLYGEDGNFRMQAAGSDRYEDLLHRASMAQTIYMHTPLHSVPADPYENDRVLFLVRKANGIRARLVRVGDNHTRVLNAVYGSSTHGEAREQLRKRFGELVEVVVTIMASQRDASDPPARAMVVAKLHADSFVRMMKCAAGGYLRRAALAYAETREDRTPTPAMRGRPQPVYGPGPLGKRVLLGFSWVRA